MLCVCAWFTDQLLSATRHGCWSPTDTPIPVGDHVGDTATAAFAGLGQNPDLDACLRAIFAAGKANADVEAGRRTGRCCVARISVTVVQRIGQRSAGGGAAASSAAGSSARRSASAVARETTDDEVAGAPRARGCGDP